jgi:endonuclease/exonuclease/phosphatase (EEP) superfamily protein YafD
MGGVSKISEFHEKKQVMSEEIIIVTWNVQKGLDPQVPGDLEGIIQQQKPDLVFLQEVQLNIFNSEPMGGYFANGWKYPWPGGTTIGVVTLSKGPPTNVQPVSSKHREFFVTAPKVCLITEHALPSGENLLAANVHLLNFERWGTYKLRTQLHQLKSTVAHHLGPIVMAGDFNTWNQKRLRLVQELADELGLKEVEDFQRDRSTADFESDFLNRLFGIQSHLPLDRVYYRGFTAHSADVLDFDSSDHRAVVVKLVLEEG